MFRKFGSIEVFLACIMMVFIMVPAFGQTIPTIRDVYPQVLRWKPDVQIKERDNGRGEATILVPVENEDKSWWEVWKPDYVYKEAKMPTKDLPKQGKPWWQFW